MNQYMSEQLTKKLGLSCVRYPQAKWLLSITRFDILLPYLIWVIGTRTGKKLTKCHFLGAIAPLELVILVTVRVTKSFK